MCSFSHATGDEVAEVIVADLKVEQQVLARKIVEDAARLKLIVNALAESALPMDEVVTAAVALVPDGTKTSSGAGSDGNQESSISNNDKAIAAAAGSSVSPERMMALYTAASKPFNQLQKKEKRIRGPKPVPGSEAAQAAQVREATSQAVRVGQALLNAKVVEIPKGNRHCLANIRFYVAGNFPTIGKKGVIDIIRNYAGMTAKKD